MRRKSLALFTVVFVASGIVAGATFRFVSWSISVLDCRQYADPDTFLAYCASPHFGYYEQGAYHLGLEPKAINALRQSEVIIFGNSREQFAFSTDVVRDYFEKRAVPFYALGFSY